jgi:hypothetical protein
VEVSLMVDKESGKKLSLRQIASLPIAERHKILAPFIEATAEDFRTDPSLTEFSVLDGEDLDLEESDPKYDFSNVAGRLERDDEALAMQRDLRDE